MFREETAVERERDASECSQSYHCENVVLVDEAVEMVSLIGIP